MIGIGVMGVAYYIGINGTALVAVAGGLSVGIGFGIKEIISNFISSLWLLFKGSVRPGEILMIKGDPCTVRKLGLRATQLRRGRDGAPRRCCTDRAGRPERLGRRRHRRPLARPARSVSYTHLRAHET